MSTAIRFRLRHYGVAVGVVILALLLTLPLQALLTSPIYALFYAAVAVSSWYGGAGSGLVATGLSTLAINYFFTEPLYSLHISNLGEIIRLGAFVLVTLLISSLNLELRTAKSRIEVSLRKLRDSEERYRCLVDTAYEGIWTSDAAGRINYVNQRMAQMLGHSIEEMRDRFIFEFMDAEARQEQERHFKRRQPLMKEQFDFRYRCKDGSDLWAIVSTSPILDDGNHLSGVLATVTDISDRRLLEQEKISRVEAEARTQVLRDTNHRITRILESITDAFISLDSEWRFTYVNGQAEQLIGKPRTALIGQIIWELFPAIHDSQYYTQIHKAVAEQMSVAYEEFYPTLNRWFAIRLYPSADGVSTYLLDISDRIQEEALREQAEILENQQKWLEAVLNLLPSPLLLIEPGTAQVTFANRAAAEMAGGEFPKNVPGEDYHTVYYCTDATGQRIPDDQMPGVRLARGERLEGFEMDWHTPQGVRSVIEVGDTLPPMYGHPATCVLVFQDITEHKQAERARTESQELFQSFMNYSPTLAFIKDEKGRYIYVNALVERLFNKSFADLVGKTDFDILPPQTARQVRENDQVVLSSGKAIELIETVPHEEGDRYYLSLKFPLQDASGRKLVAGMSLDITDRQQLEDELRQSEARFRRLVESNIIGICFPDLEGNILDANDAFLQMVGYTREELHRGKINWRAMSPPEYQELDDRKVEELRAFGTCTPFEKEYVRKDGSRIPILVGAALLEESEQDTVAFIIDLSDRKEAEAALRESEARFRQMADTAPILIWMSSPDKLCNYFNKGWLNFTGRTLEQELGKGWSEAVHPDDLQQCLGNYTTAFDKRQEFTMEYRLRRFDGEYRWIFDIGTPRFAPDGTFLGYIGSCVDINERKQAEEEIVKLNQSHNRRIKELETLLEVIPIGIGIAEDAQCHYIRANPPLAQLLRISPQVNASLSAPDCEKPPFKVYRNGRELKVDELPMQYAAAHGVEVPNQEIEIVYDNGDSTQLLVSVAPLFDEESQPRGCIAAFLDITERKLSEAKIRQLNEQLERRVKERTAQLEVANQELESFSYSVSHDLRAPLRHIDGFVNLLQKRTGGTLDETSQRYFNTITQTVKQAGVMIDHLLALSRVGRTQLRWAAVDMNQLVQEIQRELTMDTNERVVHWQIAELPWVEGDASLLRLAVRNLLENALKYTRTRPQAEIVMGSTSTETEILFFVRDNGVGFDMRYVQKLFGVFQRLHTEQDFEGNGIGLANVQRIIHRHGGRTWAEGAVDKGATFYFSMPKGVRGEEG
ncbi:MULTISPECIES: PAS domain S-box protein [unclassified Coleofasciculus]|uniref:PAS domain S-box protein n=1 Tax=unclassified Coleofasciculus TaxID=2692782 RepID=UPI001D15B411|nr:MULTISPECIES: PAS domain S-box protein [unclassified Coleofasciculus]